jgi:hypothetical protein
MIRRICLAFAMALLCVNVSAKQKPLPMPLAEALPVEVVLNQHELAVDVPNTAGAVGGQFGLIGMLIASGIQNVQVKNAEERVVPLRNALLDYHFNEHLEAVLRERLASDGLSPAPVITVLQTPWDAVEAQQNKQDMPLHAMVIYPRYSVDSGLTTLSVSLNVSIVDRTVKPSGKIKTRYAFSRNYGFHFPLLGDSEDNAKRWTDIGSARLSGLLDQGIAQATDMLVYDFSTEGRALWEQKIKRESATVKGISYPGRAVRQTADWAWMRNTGSLQGYAPVSAADPVPPATAIAAAPMASDGVAMPASTDVPVPATPVPAAPVPAGAETAVPDAAAGVPSAPAASGAH